jgi:hypothetical protein
MNVSLAKLESRFYMMSLVFAVVVLILLKL